MGNNNAAHSHLLRRCTGKRSPKTPLGQFLSGKWLCSLRGWDWLEKVCLIQSLFHAASERRGLCARGLFSAVCDANDSLKCP